MRTKILGLILALVSGVGGFASGFAYSAITTPRPEPPVTPPTEPEPVPQYQDTERLLVCGGTDCLPRYYINATGHEHTEIGFVNLSVNERSNQVFWGWRYADGSGCYEPVNNETMCTPISINVVGYRYVSNKTLNVFFEAGKQSGTCQCSSVVKIDFPEHVELASLRLYTERGILVNVGYFDYGYWFNELGVIGYS